MKLDIFNVEALSEHCHLRRRVPQLKQVVAKMAAASDGDVGIYDEGTALFLKELPPDNRTPVGDRLLRAYIHHFRRDVILTGQYRRASVKAALFGT